MRQRRLGGAVIGLVAAVIAAGAGGCRGGRSYVRVTVDSDETVQVKELAVVVTNAGRAADPVKVPGASGSSVGVHLVFALEFAADRRGPVTIDVTASLSPAGTRSGQGMGEIRPGETTDVTIRLEGGGAANLCANGAKDPGETAVDCGGQNCLPCALGQGCALNDDCLSQTCGANNTCRGWEPVAPWGASTVALAARPDRPDIALAGTLGAIFRTTDGGTGWRRAVTDLDADEPVVSLALDPARPAVAYARTQTRVLRSTDEGASWTEQPGPFGELSFDYPPITSIAVAPTTPPVLLVGAEQGVWAAPEGGSPMRGLIDHRVTALAVDPQAPSIAYAGTQDAGIHRSTNAGQTWSVIAAPNTPAGMGIVTAIAVSPSGSPAWVYAATTQGLFRLDPAAPGNVWSRVAPDVLAGPVSHVSIDPKNPANVFAAARDQGAYRTQHGGFMDWRDGLRDPTDVLQLVPAGDTVYAATPIGVYRNAQSQTVPWQSASRGMDGFRIQAVAVDPTQPDTVYVAVSPWLFPGVLWKSTDGGRSAAVVRGVNDPTALLPVVAGNQVILHAGVFGNPAWKPGYSNSGDGGKTWRTPVVVDGSIDGVTGSLAVDPANAARLFLSVATGNGDSAGVYQSADTGKTWTPITRGLPAGMHDVTLFCQPNALVFDALRNLYAAGCGVWRLPPNGAAWQPASGGPQSAVDDRTATLALAADGSLFAGGDGGLYQTRNPGAQSPIWTRLGTVPGPSPGVYAIAPHPTDAQVVWVGTPSVIARSAGGGTENTWTLQRVTRRFITGFAFKPQAPDTIYAGTEGVGLLKTTTGGQ